MPCSQKIPNCESSATTITVVHQEVPQDSL